MVQAVKSCFSKYATFRGRATRSEFWWFHLFLVVASLILFAIDNVAGFTYGASTFTVNDTVYDAGGAGVLQSIFALVVLLPSLAVAARRFHDAGHSGLWIIWCYLLLFACLAGAVIYVVFACQKSQPGDTKYGPHPAT